ncbi:MAG: RagB/SusD family nutrient uptake outer membrane protein, partial [Dysgonamonadaceae bacterium]|nr:RagB/SusD family nutrient uptake outer membrane protein [Dysgonamonadaceae bacterium]
MKKIYLIATIAMSSIFWFTSCVDLDITPTSIITGEAIYNENGIKAYMAGMYNHLPMEDFHYDTDNNGSNEGPGAGYFVNLNIFSFWNSTGEMVNRNNPGFKRHRPGLWSGAFKIIRQANTLVSELPKYPALADQSKAWIAEAKFIRAYVYFQLAKRYGGLPKVFEPQTLSSNESDLWVARESHADTYDFILKDLDDAIADMPARSEAGRANRYVAAALKSRVALHAGTTARYGSIKFPDWDVDGLLLQGIPSDRANDYFRQAWDAAKFVEDGGSYELHNANANKTDNYAEIWEKAESNKESIWLRKYDYTMTVHSYDAVMCPPRMATTYGDRFNPTLDWVELFDGLPIDPATGHFSAFDANGYYIVYDNSKQLWENSEPRLQANILIPGNLYKGGMKLDLRSGIFKKE